MKHWPKVWPVFCESKELLIKTKTLTKKPRHRTRCLLRSKTKLRTEYSATEAILSLLCSKVFIVTSHLAQEAKCSQLFVTTLYPPPPPPPPPAADLLSKPSTELRALSTTFYFQTTIKMFCQLQLTTILRTCLLWKGGSWTSRELLILALLDAQTDPRGSISTLEKYTLTCLW